MTEQEYDWKHHEQVRSENQGRLGIKQTEHLELVTKSQEKLLEIVKLRREIECPQHQWKNAGSQMQMGWETCELCGTTWVY